MVPPGRLERPHPAPEAGALSAELWGPAHCAHAGTHPECITRLAAPQGRRSHSYAIVESRASAPASNGERGASMPDVHRIGIISNTHIQSRASRVPDAALRHFEDVELILHAGDLSVLAVLDQLAAFAPVEAVQGNAARQARAGGRRLRHRPGPHPGRPPDLPSQRAPRVSPRPRRRLRPQPHSPRRGRRWLALAESRQRHRSPQPAALHARAAHHHGRAASGDHRAPLTLSRRAAANVCAQLSARSVEAVPKH